MSDAGIGAFARLVQGDARDAAVKLAASLSAEQLLALVDELQAAAGWESHMVEHDVDDWSGRRKKVVTYLGKPAAEEEWVRSATSGVRHRLKRDTDAPETREALRRIGLSRAVALCGVGVVPWDGPGATEGDRCQRCAARSA